MLKKNAKGLYQRAKDLLEGLERMVAVDETRKHDLAQ